MVVINPIPGQEERNSDHLLEEGVAIRCNNLPALAYKIDRLIKTPGKLSQMSETAKAGEAASSIRTRGSTSGALPRRRDQRSRVVRYATESGK